MKLNDYGMHQETILGKEAPEKRDNGHVDCLGMMFENDEARSEFFLVKLREGLEELCRKLGGVPFTTVADAVNKMRSIEKWPMGDENHLRELAELMRRADSSKDILQRWKDEIGFPHGEIEESWRSPIRRTIPPVPIRSSRISSSITASPMTRRRTTTAGSRSPWM